MKLTDLQFKKATDAKLTRSGLKVWKREFYKKDRTEAPKEFYTRIKEFMSKVGSKTGH